MPAIASMTGFGRGNVAAGDREITVEVRSVNGRGLDVRLRLAPGFEALEPEIRKRVSARFARGSVNLSLNAKRSATAGAIRVNRVALETVLGEISSLRERLESPPPRAESVLSLPGVLEFENGANENEDEAGLQASALEAVDQALEGLSASRLDEGKALSELVTAQVAEIAELTAKAEANPARSRDAILAKLKEQVADVAANAELDPDRLHQEALLLATKADIREELDRLVAHVAAARDLIKTGGPVGRRLDFLTQEFNREANTLCSKSNAVELTAIGLDLKAVVDRLREQVQNIE